MYSPAFSPASLISNYESETTPVGRRLRITLSLLSPPSLLPFRRLLSSPRSLSSSCRLPSKDSRSNLPRSNLTPFSFIRSLLRCPRRILCFATFVRFLPSFNSRFLALLSVPPPHFPPFSFFSPHLWKSRALYIYIYDRYLYFIIGERERGGREKKTFQKIIINFFSCVIFALIIKKNAGFPKARNLTKVSRNAARTPYDISFRNDTYMWKLAA